MFYEYVLKVCLIFRGMMSAVSASRLRLTLLWTLKAALPRTSRPIQISVHRSCDLLSYYSASYTCESCHLNCQNPFAPSSWPNLLQTPQHGTQCTTCVLSSRELLLYFCPTLSTLSTKLQSLWGYALLYMLSRSCLRASRLRLTLCKCQSSHLSYPEQTL